jgi:hypothetical protein
MVERGLYIFFNQPRWELYSDMNSYADRAWRLADPTVRLTAADTFLAPGTPLLMAPLMRLAGNRDDGLLLDQGLWWLFAVGTLWAVAAVAWRLFRHPFAALLALVALDLYWPLTSYAAYFMSENPMAFFMSTSSLCMLTALDEERPGRRPAWFALAGILGGVALTIRPQFAVSVGLAALPLMSRRWPFVRWRDVAVLAVPLLVPVLGVSVLNSRAAGHPMGVSSNGGFNFFQGHCDVHTVETRDASGVYVWASPARVQYFYYTNQKPTLTVVTGHPPWDDAYFFARGLECIRQDGVRHVGRLAINLLSLFLVTPWPQVDTQASGVRMAILNLGYVGLLVFTVPLAWSTGRRRKAERWLLLQLLAVFPVGLLIYGDSRFRIPYDMFGVLLWVGVVAQHYGLRRDGTGSVDAGLGGG